MANDILFEIGTNSKNLCRWEKNMVNIQVWYYGQIPYIGIPHGQKSRKWKFTTKRELTKNGLLNKYFTGTNIWIIKCYLVALLKILYH